MRTPPLLILFVILISVLSPQTKTMNTQAQSLNHPPIPTESPETEKIAIVTLNKPQSPRQILEKYPELKLRYVFEHVLNGFSVKGPARALEQLAKQQPNIIDVSSVVTYQTENATLPVRPIEINPKPCPKPCPNPITKIGPIKPETSQNQNVLTENRPNQNSITPTKNPTPTDANLQIIGADEARGLFDNQNRRLTGKGVTVGVIDTGIDYTHPDLKANFKGGHDFVDGDKDPMETKGIPGRSTLHGTHVAGIIAANGKIKGVAPEASLIAYRALGPGGSGTTEQVIAAIEQAVKDKVDILNLSLGNSVNGPDLPISLALNKAVEKGVTAVTSSGNSGPNRWTVGSPGTASKAISVGASTPPMKIPYLQLSNQHTIRLEPLQGSPEWNHSETAAIELTYGGLGRTKELKNVKGKIVLLKRGELTFTQKAKNAAKAGAKGVIIFNNTKGSFSGNLEEMVSIPVMAISKQDGEQLRKQTVQTARTILIEESDILADFSSRGPVTVTWEIKPDVIAPGVAINSTIPGGYLELQGTSMAAPHVAGACALIKQAHPEWGPDEIKASLMNTAKPITNQKSEPYKTFEQGSGRIQPVQAIKTESLVQPASLQFGKFQLSDKLHQHQASLKIKNISSSKKNYYFTIPKTEEGINWHFPLSVTLMPDEEKTVTIDMTVQPEHFTKKIYDGYLQLNEGANRINIPYLYVVEEPDYPRVMGFEFGLADKEKTYRYEVYLPGGADEFGIALFHPGNHQFVGYLDWRRKVAKGVLKNEVNVDLLPAEGLYVAKVFAKKQGREDMIETMIEILSKSEESPFEKNTKLVK
ncbi:S8 family serine peptidase [Neobacillus sp. LXY-4]|uniref:S8 family serine peptidase n=1 Tax=Neobacillus sp. LXY-4 TaxID=3379826 RepID=UPI003EDF58A5